MTLAQEKSFKSGTPFKSRLSYDIPTRNPRRAEETVNRLRNDYKNMSKEEQRQVRELLQETWRVLLHLTKDKRRLTSTERQDVWKIAIMYAALKNEFTKGERV